MKNKHFKTISLFLSTFFLALFSLANSVKAETITSVDNSFNSKNELNTTVGNYIKFEGGGSTNYTCKEGRFDESGNCAAGKIDLVGTNTNEAFWYRYAVSSNNVGLTVFSLGAPLIGNDLTTEEKAMQFTPNLNGFEGSGTGISSKQIEACMAGIIRTYNTRVDGTQNLYMQSEATYNQEYYSAQKTIQAFYVDGLTLTEQINKFKTQHYSNGVDRTKITYDKVQYNGKDVANANEYLLNCVWDAIKADYSDENRLAGISKYFGSDGKVSVTSTSNDSTKTIEIDIASLYGKAANNNKNNNYLRAQEYNDGSLISVVLKKDGTTVKEVKGGRDTKQFAPYVYIETEKWDSESRYDDKFKINVCYSNDSSSTECKAMRSADKDYKALTPGKYELEFTLGGIIYDSYGTLGYSDSANKNAYVTNKIYRNTASSDSVTFKTTFTVPETSGGEETTKDGAINITYVDEDGNGIKGAIFKISGTSNTCTTNTSGKCSITGLEVGKSYKVISYSRPSGYDEPTPSSHTVNLTTTSKTKDITFTSSKEEQTTEKGIIKIGYYLDGNTNNGIEGAIFKAVSGSTVKTCTTDADGYCEIKNLDLGKSYNVSAEEVPEGYSNAKTNSGSATYGITLTTSNKTATLSFKSSKVDTTLGIITVEYLENNNNKILGGEFYLYKVGSSKVIDTCETNSQGTCVFSNLELGEYKVVLNKVPENYEDSKQEKRVTLSKDNLKETIKFTGTILEAEEPIVKVSVVNYNKVTEYIKGVKLVIKDSSGNVIKEFLSEEKEMILNDITEPGTYTIEVKEVPEGYEAKDTTYTFEVKESEETNVVIKLIPKTNVPNTLSNASKIFIAAGIIGIITGAYLVYTNVKNKKEEM